MATYIAGIIQDEDTDVEEKQEVLHGILDGALDTDSELV